MKAWVKAGLEGKFLVVRRDGSIPAWPHFVLGARDPAAPAALRAYADAADAHGMDAEFAQSVREIADEFEVYRAREGRGDPDAPPHRHDNGAVVDLMGGRIVSAFVSLWRELSNTPKG